MLGIAVPGQEALKPDHIRRRRRPDQDSAHGPFEESHPPKDERAHDAFAEIGFGDQERPQSVSGDQQGLDVALGGRVHQRRAAGELADLGQEVAHALFDDRSDVAQSVALGHRDEALEHDKHAGRDFSRFVQLLPVRKFA